MTRRSAPLIVPWPATLAGSRLPWRDCRYSGSHTAAGGGGGCRGREVDPPPPEISRRCEDEAAAVASAMVAGMAATTDSREAREFWRAWTCLTVVVRRGAGVN